MKNQYIYVILAIIGILAICSISYLYFNYLNNNRQIQENNKEYIELSKKEITGNTFATLINKTIDKNNKNNVSKDEKGYYLNNGTNSIIIELKFTESEEIYRIEQIAQKGIENFIRLYSNFKFKCSKIEYHEKTNYISYLYFEQL